MMVPLGQVRACAPQAVLLARPFAPNRPAELISTTFGAITWVCWLFSVVCEQGKWFLKSCMYCACSASFAASGRNMSVCWRYVIFVTVFVASSLNAIIDLLFLC